MNIAKLRRLVKHEEVDYQTLCAYLSGYARSRDKISRWVKTGELIRVKKGLYVFGPDVALKPYSREVLANLIYGPSAISLHYALSYYGFIPERVVTVTSVTNKRNKRFETPVGVFQYYYLRPEIYAVGINLVELDDQTHCLMASPEKALCDLVYIEKPSIPSNNIEDYLLLDMRMDEEQLLQLDNDTLYRIADRYSLARVKNFVTSLMNWIQKNE